MIFGPDWSFVQNPKAASSSITDALLPHCAPVHPGNLPLGKPSKHDIPHPGAAPFMPHRLGVVRNPWDRLVSAWCYLQERRPKNWTPVGFREFVMGPGGWYVGRAPALVNFCRVPQSAWLWYCSEVIAFEHLSFTFGRWSKLVIGHEIQLPRTNRSERSGGYIGYYTREDGSIDQELVDFVQDIFAYDVKAFGYEFARDI